MKVDINEKNLILKSEINSKLNEIFKHLKKEDVEIIKIVDDSKKLLSQIRFY
ncbi:MAG: hypothetical protein ACRC0V_00165 [Fusobacteriaceae bacterium]